MRRTATLAALIVLAALLAVAGCDDDGTKPQSGPPEYPFPDTSDNLVANVVHACETMDLAAFTGMLGESFRFEFIPADSAALGIPGSWGLAQELAAAATMFSGGAGRDPVTGDLVAAVTAVSVDVFEQLNPWTDAAPEDGHPGAQKARFNYQVLFTRPGSFHIIATGQAEFFVVTRDSTSGGVTRPFHQLVGWRDLGFGGGKDGFSWGKAKALYLDPCTHGGPEAVIAHEALSAVDPATFHFDASGSSEMDPDYDLHAEPYRWSYDDGAGQFEAGEWTADPVWNVTFPAAGDYTVTLEVRNAWGCTDAATVEISAGPSAPATPDELMDRFREAYGGRDIAGYTELLDDAFRFQFLQADVEALNLPSDRLDLAKELNCAANMFSGEPGSDPLTGDPVAGISSITFELFQHEGTWGPTDDMVNFPDTQRAVFDTQVSFLRPGSTTIIVQGHAIFYAAQIEIEAGGEAWTQYRLRGWIDRTATKVTENATWGGVKVVYR
jgi:hypothetical protein